MVDPFAPRVGRIKVLLAPIVVWLAAERVALPSAAHVGHERLVQRAAAAALAAHQQHQRRQLAAHADC
eukprot:1468233-Prymnesium_polylepis.1